MAQRVPEKTQINEIVVEITIGLFAIACSESDVLWVRVREVETIEVHHLVPDPNEIMDKLFVCVLTSVDLRQCPKLSI